MAFRFHFHASHNTFAHPSELLTTYHGELLLHKPNKIPAMMVQIPLTAVYHTYLQQHRLTLEAQRKYIHVIIHLVMPTRKIHMRCETPRKSRIA